MSPGGIQLQLWPQEILTKCQLKWVGCSQKSQNTKVTASRNKEMARSEVEVFSDCNNKVVNIKYTNAICLKK